MFVDKDNGRSSGSRYGLWGHKQTSSYDPGDPEVWKLDNASSSCPGSAGARHNGSLSTSFADGHAKLIPTPIANSHTADKRLFWASPVHLDRTDLN